MVEPAAHDLKAQRAPPAVAASRWLRPLPPATRLIFHGESAARAAAATAFQVPFAERACRACARGERATLWLGPDEYLLLAPAGEPAAEIAAALAAVVVGIPHAIVDVSHRQIAVEVHGPHAARLLNGACPLDLDASEFPVGACTRTVFAKADIVLWRTAADSFRVETWRSFAEYLAALLAEIGKDFDHGD